jgi:hypothetical protein
LVVVVFLLLSSSSPKTLCILRITINHTHSYDVSFRSFAIFFFCLSPSRRPKIPYNKLDDDEKKNNKNTDEESSALFHHKSKNPVTVMSQKKNICLSSSFFSDLSLSFSRRRQK